MRKWTALCAFALVAAGAAAVGATTDPTAMRGSDTLYELFANPAVDSAGPPAVLGGLIANCTGVGTVGYVGTGSGNGESAILTHAVQRIAPMSRAVAGSAAAAGCSVDNSAAEGIVFALDGVSINVAGDFGAACSAPANTQGTCAAGELCVDNTGDGTGDVCASGAAQCSPSANDCNAATGTASGLAYSKTFTVKDLNGFPGIQCTPHVYSYGSGFDTTAASAAEVSATLSGKVIGCTGGKNSASYTIGGAGGTSADQNTATFGWRDVIRILLLGMPNGTVKTIGNRDCNSDLRWTLAQDYKTIYQTDCSANNCGPVRHIFRRDEFSGTTDVFLATLGMDGIDVSKFDHLGFDGASSSPVRTYNDGKAYKNSRSFFCNVRRFEDSWPYPDDARFDHANLGQRRSVASGTDPNTQVTLGGGGFNPPYRAGEANCPQGQTMMGASGTTGPSCTPTPAGTATTPINEFNTRPFFPEYQDNDPIRRSCDHVNLTTNTTASGFPNDYGRLDQLHATAGVPENKPTEVVCGARGTLGLVLPVSLPPSNTADAIRYPTQFCTPGVFELRVGPIKDDGTCDYCPNGDRCAGGLCRFPIIASSRSANCINWSDNMPAVTDAAHAVNALPGPFVADGRVYNLYMHDGSAISQDYVKISNRTLEVDAGNNVVPVNHIGAYYRIHSLRSLVGDGTASTCKQNDDTQHIACLVNASKCSLGFSGREGPELQVGTMEAKVNNLEPSQACIRELLNNLSAGDFGDPAKNYPMSRKMFLNTIVGFESAELSAGELALSKCTSSISDARLGAFGFISLPEDQSNPLLRDPFCQDFNGAACTTVNTADACPGNPVGIPSNKRICKQPANTAATAPCVAGEVCKDLNSDGTGDVCGAP